MTHYSSHGSFTTEIFLSDQPIVHTWKYTNKINFRSKHLSLTQSVFQGDVEDNTLLTQCLMSDVSSLLLTHIQTVCGNELKIL